MRLAILLAIALLPAFAVAADAHPGDVVLVEAAGLKLGGELLSDSPDALRLKMTSGEVAIPRALVRSIAVVRAAPPPPPPAPALPAPPIAPAMPPAPRFVLPHGAWIDRWAPQISVAALGGAGGTHVTPFAKKPAATSAGAALGIEVPLPWIAFGLDGSYEEMRESLVAAGSSGCPSNLGGACFQFPDGVDHLSVVARGMLYAKPYLMLGAWRPWARVGGEIASTQYHYAGRSKSYGSGSDTAAGVRAGAGVDFATASRGLVLSASVDAGGAHAGEKIDSLFGAPWKVRDSGPVSTDARVSVGLAIPLGGSR